MPEVSTVTYALSVDGRKGRYPEEVSIGAALLAAYEDSLVHDRSVTIVRVEARGERLMFTPHVIVTVFA